MLMVAAKYRATECVRLLLEAAADDPYGFNINATNISDQTALLVAAEAGEVECLELLRKVEGCNLSAVDGAGQNAFITAAQNGRVELMGHLWRYDICGGEDVDAVDTVRDKMLSLMCEYRSPFGSNHTVALLC